MSSTAAQPKDILTDVLSARVPPGFAEQVRAVAQAEGCKPGALIREAVSERIARAGALIAIKMERSSPASGQEA